MLVTKARRCWIVFLGIHMRSLFLQRLEPCEINWKYFVDNVVETMSSVGRWWKSREAGPCLKLLTTPGFINRMSEVWGRLASESERKNNKLWSYQGCFASVSLVNILIFDLNSGHYFRLHKEDEGRCGRRSRTTRARGQGNPMIRWWSFRCNQVSLFCISVFDK